MQAINERKWLGNSAGRGKGITKCIEKTLKTHRRYKNVECTGKSWEQQKGAEKGWNGKKLIFLEKMPKTREIEKNNKIILRRIH